MHQWTFNDGTASDSIGGANGALLGGATISGGRLIVDNTLSSPNQASSGQRMNAPLPDTVAAKTLVAWVSLANLTQHGGSALSIESTTTNPFAQRFDAIDYAERSLRLIPIGRESAFAYTALAMAHSASGDLAAAAMASARAAQANPRFSVAHVLQAAALYRLDRLEEAKAAARRVIECEPDFTATGFVRAHTGRAEIWQPIGDALRRLGLPD